ncbi:MAG: type VI secretion system tip protein VgrG [Alphaproteobacteria bacterium]|nr:type VI secretion system tip protein VgrG [Alphaproteobacteria bacterium]
MATILHNQEGLLAQVTASFAGKDTVLSSLRGKEGISELFEFQAVFSSSNSSVDLEKVLGSGITLTIKSETQEIYHDSTDNVVDETHVRYIDGIIAEFSQGHTQTKGDGTTITEYTAIIKPSLWLLTLDKNYLIFQNKSAIDIIKQVLSDNGIKDLEDKTSSCGKVVREYCVQYGESSFNFISRLMEDEGIFYYFKHEQGKHTLVLADSSNGYENVSIESKGGRILGRQVIQDGSSSGNGAKISFIQSTNAVCPLNRIFNTKITTAVNSGSYSAADYNYTISQTKLFSKLDTRWKGQNVYDYPGGFEKLKDGDNLSKLRVQQFEFKHKLFSANSTAAILVPGHFFEVTGHPAKNFNKKYVVYHIEHFFDFDNVNGFVYRNNISAFDSNTEFRPPRITPKPRIYGSQTAVVTCPSGEEIFRNEYCAVKVHFYWDQVGESADTDKSSCWIRVAQLLAGSGWGAIFVPRVGQEVVVTFLNGDPDKPLITGCVYNDQYMPAYSDQDAMKSSLKTVTFKNDDEEGFNEFRFYDEKDKEEIYVHAQKDVYVDIINSRKTDIEESDDTLTLLKGNRSIFLKSDEGNNEVKHTMEITKGDQIVNLKEGNLKYTITKGNSEITLSEGNETIKLEKGNRTITLSKGDLKYDVTGDCTFKISGDLTIKADGNIKIEAGKQISMKSGTNMKIESGTDLSAKSGTGFKAEAGMNFDIKATMNLTMNANINMEAKANVNMQLQSNVNMSVKSNVMFEASGMAMTKLGGPGAMDISGAAISVSGMGATQIKSPVIQLSGAIKLG